jgi:hypothetical protein
MVFSLTVSPRSRTAPRQKLGIGAIALALRKWRRGRIIGEEPGDGVANRFRHRHGFDDRLSRLGQRFTFCRIGGHHGDLERRSAPVAATPPNRRRSRLEVAPVIVRFGAIGDLGGPA